MKSENLKFLKIRKVKAPNRAHEFDAGFDMYVPEDLTLDQMKENFKMVGCQPSVSFAEDNETITQFHLLTGYSILIPSGIKVKIPNGYALIAFNKSGIAAKRNLIVGSCVCDQEYQGEILINIHNIGNIVQDMNAGEKIVQFLSIPINYCGLEEIDTLEELYSDIGKTTRGDGSFGSTGNGL